MDVIDDEDISVEKALIHHEEGVDLIPSNIDLSALEINMVNAISREVLMRVLINEIKDAYDYIIIDCISNGFSV